MSEELQQYIKGLGFPYAELTILSFVGGSQMHGAKIENTDDTDWYGLFIVPPTKMLGLDRYEHFVHTTGGKRGGNRPSDIDVCMYGLQKWASLASKGNPSVLHFLFAPPVFQHALWAKLSLQRDAFLAKSHIGAFLGYANAQLKRLLNQQGQKNCHRPLLEGPHGYDTKYAMHITRLLCEAKELMTDGKITLPRPEKDLLIDIRLGKFKLHELEQMNKQLEVEALAAKEKSQLPDSISRERVSELVTDLYLDYWDWMDEGASR
jgi:predicted nucleotidyltransferase